MPMVWQELDVQGGGQGLNTVTEGGAGMRTEVLHVDGDGKSARVQVVCDKCRKVMLMEMSLVERGEGVGGVCPRCGKGWACDVGGNA